MIIIIKYRWGEKRPAHERSNITKRTESHSMHHLLFFLAAFSPQSPLIKILYFSFFWSGTRRHNKKSFCDSWTHQNQDCAPLWVGGPGPVRRHSLSQGTAESRLPTSRWAVPPYNPSLLQPQTECRPFCHSTSSIPFRCFPTNSRIK